MRIRTYVLGIFLFLLICIFYFGTKDIDRGNSGSRCVSGSVEFPCQGNAVLSSNSIDFLIMNNLGSYDNASRPIIIKQDVKIGEVIITYPSGKNLKCENVNICMNNDNICTSSQNLTIQNEEKFILHLTGCQYDHKDIQVGITTRFTVSIPYLDTSNNSIQTMLFDIVARRQ